MPNYKATEKFPLVNLAVGLRTTAKPYFGEAATIEFITILISAYAWGPLFHGTDRGV